VYAVIPGQGEGRQYLAGVRLAGIRPDRSVTIRGSCPGGTSLTRKLSVSIGLRQDAQPTVSLTVTGTGVAEDTCGSWLSCGSFFSLYTMTS
jgi:hypothetical protein